MMGILLSACWLAAGCSAIDDDLSDCPADEQQYRMVYQLKLITNMTTEISTKLNTVTETSVANALRAYLSNIFTAFAHDVDLSFYDTDGSFARLHHDRHIMDANQSSYTLTMPMHKYMHLAVANIAENDLVGLSGDEYSNSSMLRQVEGKVTDGLTILPSHTTGLFTARQPMEVIEGVDQTFNVRLYMVNSAAALVLDPKGQTFKDLKVYATGFANDFLIKDSTYVYESTSTMIIAQPVETGNNLLCFCSVNFPSRDAAPASSARKRAGSATPLWRFKVYFTKMDGTVTETVLDISEPLNAGDLRIIKGSLDDEGAVIPYDSTVGVSVTLDWNEGGSYNPEL